MAQDRAAPEAKRFPGVDRAAKSADAPTDRGSSTDPGEVIDLIDDADEAAPGSIDNLLALTDDGWDIDQQVKKLQTAAGQQPAFRPEIPRAPNVPSVMVPTPFELGLRPAPVSIPSPASPTSTCCRSTTGCRTTIRSASSPAGAPRSSRRAPPPTTGR